MKLSEKATLILAVNTGVIDNDIPSHIINGANLSFGWSHGKVLTYAGHTQLPYDSNKDIGNYEWIARYAAFSLHET